MDAGALRVVAALPDPPFELGDGPVRGFDPDVMGAVAAVLGRTLQFDRYSGADFDGIFAVLDRENADVRADVVASGATEPTPIAPIAPGRQAGAAATGACACSAASTAGSCISIQAMTSW